MDNSGYVVQAKTQEGAAVLLWDFAGYHEYLVESKLYNYLLKMGVKPAEQECHLKKLGWEIVKFEFTIAEAAIKDLGVNYEENIRSIPETGFSPI